MERQDALDCIERYTAELWNDRQYERAVNLFAEDFQDHDPLPSQDKGFAGYIEMVKIIHAAYPDLQVKNDGLYYDEQQQTVVARWSAIGSHGGTLLGMLLSKKPVKLKGIDIFRVADGFICERWGEFDSLGIFT